MSNQETLMAMGPSKIIIIAAHVIVGNTIPYLCKYCKKLDHWLIVHSCSVGSGCGTVDTTVASDTSRPGLESSHRQLLLNNYLLLTVCIRGVNKEIEAEKGH